MITPFRIIKNDYLRNNNNNETYWLATFVSFCDFLERKFLINYNIENNDIISSRQAEIDRFAEDFLRIESIEDYINSNFQVRREGKMITIDNFNCWIFNTEENLNNLFEAIKKLNISIEEKKFFEHYELLLKSNIEDMSKEKISLLKLQDYVNSQENFLITTDGRELNYANKHLLEYFCYETLEEFKKEQACVCLLFEETNKYFDLRQVKNTYEWIDKLRTIKESKRIVLFKNKRTNNIEYFQVKINKCHNLYVVSFTNITETLNKQIILEKKLHIDFLTKANNRRFFHDNINSVINSLKEEELGIIIADIDDFKLVNDIYGHDKGDYVLEKLSKEIKKILRKEDFLIRWGGEEFLILTKIKNIEELKIVSEKVKSYISCVKFDIERKITISIGGSMYIEKEDIYNTIKRADEGLYKSKHEGKNKVSIV